jgi:hypothetical protein
MLENKSSSMSLHSSACWQTRWFVAFIVAAEWLITDKQDPDNIQAGCESNAPHAEP